MHLSNATAADGALLSATQIREPFEQGLAGQFRHQRLAVLIPDHTRTMPMANLFRVLVLSLADTKQPYQRILSCAPPIHTECWTAREAMCKLELALAEGGELTIYAPHLNEVSLGYVDPASINPPIRPDREDEGVWYVPKAGEILDQVR